MAITFDSTTEEITNYPNGVQVNFLDGATPAAWNPEPWKIGNSGTCYPWSGLIDEIAIYDRALTPLEITLISQAGSSGKCVFADGFESGDMTNWPNSVP